MVFANFLKPRAVFSAPFFKVVGAFLFFALLFCFVQSAQANVYDVQNVKVDIVAQSSLEARDQAFLEAQSQAFEILKSRFVEDPQTVQTPEIKIISRLVRDVELVREQSSARRYVATFNIRFKPAATRAHFGKAPLTSFSDADDKGENKLLIIPIFEQDKNTALWNESQNALLQIWRKNSASLDMQNIILPEANSLDKLDVKQDIFDNFNRGQIKRIAARYSANNTALVRAVFDPQKSPQLKIEFYKTDGRKLVMGQTLEFNVEKEKTLGALIKRALPKIVETLNGNWAEKPQTEFESILAGEAVPLKPEKIIEEKNNIQEKAGDIIAPQSGSAQMVVPFQNMNEWIGLRRILSSTPSISSIRIQNIKTFEADIIVNYVDFNALIRNLQDRGFEVRRLSENKFLLLRRWN